MSNLIKHDQRLRFEIQAFEGEEFRHGRGRSGGRSSGAGEPTDPMGLQDENDEERLARLEREAYEKGFEQGHKDGMALGEKRLEERARQMEALLRELGRLKGRLYHEAEGDLLKLSVEIARQIVRAEAKTDPELITRVVRAAIDHLADRSRIRILVHPGDMAALRKALPEAAEGRPLEAWELIDDRSVERGGCLLESGFGKVNATIEEQLQVLAEELAAEHERHAEARRGTVA